MKWTKKREQGSIKGKELKERELNEGKGISEKGSNKGKHERKEKRRKRNIGKGKLEKLEGGANRNVFPISPIDCT